jgi:hypothetical protein
MEKHMTRSFTALSLLLAFALDPVGVAWPATPFAGRQYHLALMGSNLKFPIFTKEFSEGPDIIPTGGKKEIWLPGEKKAIGLRFGFEDIGYNRAGFGVGLGLWHAGFANATFRYDRFDNQDFFATYRDPTHTFASLDLNGIYLPWESQGKALGVYGLLSLVGDRESYTIERFATADGQPGFSSFDSADRQAHSLRLGFGLGLRFYFSRHLAPWLEKRWFMGETFSSGGQVAAGGFIEDDRQRTLFAPINSLGASLSF